ncbi:Uncharacterised protein [Klebsiella oxytoca]|nr:Uncharacterised protein [Klebsiella oxytoca]
MTLTTDELRRIVETDHVQCGDAAAMARELLANREAQPVPAGKFAGWGLYHAGSDDFGSWLKSKPQGDCSDAITKHGYVNVKLYTAPPAPAVPEEISSAIRHLKDTLVACNRFNYCSDAVNRVEDACRAAMLAQPVSSGYKLPDNVREALTLAIQAMEFMGDALNNIDAVCTEDVEYVTPAFNAVRELLAAAPEGGNG